MRQRQLDVNTEAESRSHYLLLKVIKNVFYTLHSAQLHDIMGHRITSISSLFSKSKVRKTRQSFHICSVAIRIPSHLIVYVILSAARIKTRHLSQINVKYHSESHLRQLWVKKTILTVCVYQALLVIALVREALHSRRH